MRPFVFKFQYGEHVILTKSDGTFCRVEIEGCSCGKNTSHVPIYQVREVETRVGYPASEKSLTKVRSNK